ncbi:MAG: NADH:flavin oxidoreductase/NADH oxidase [Betaproteobacteria bacterium]|nr:NADH:flavin oxidoreductase/NADH oxidase [Betaproteobacteria bacterium]
MTELFSPLALRSVTLPNRIAIPPMCQYAAKDGMANDFHFANYARFAMGGAGLIIVEATAIDPAGRISHGDLGLWHDAQIRPLQRLTRFLTSLGAIPAIQINHGGRKAGQRRPWHGNSPLDQSDAARGEAPWPVIGPSALAMADNWPMPRSLDKSDIQGLVDAWGAAARRADEAGFEAVEIHAAHGYLLNQFLSPLSNRRNDAYGGDRAGRMRFVLEVTEAVRSCWPRQKPLLVRVSAVDGVDGGWDIDDTVVLAHELKARGVDAIHCSSGGLFGAATAARLPRVPGFQVPFAERVRHEARVPTIAVGLILTPQQAADVIDTGKADIVAIGREALADPNWALHARLALLPERGFADWPVESGWWLERRQAAMATTG